MPTVWLVSNRTARPDYRDNAALSPDVVPADVSNLPLSDHRHHLHAGQRSSGRPEATEAEPWPDQPLYAAMVLLHDVVQYLTWRSCERRQSSAFCFISVTAFG